MKIRGFLSYRRFSLLLILIGIALRLCNFIYNRSLWCDEAWVAQDILIRTYKEIFFNIISHPDLIAVLPAGFLLIEKLSVNTFGNNECALRLFPFFCGTLAVVFYWILLKKWASQITAVMALSFFVFSESLIYYSSECKQYSGEVLTAIALYLAAMYFQARSASIGRIFIFALIGMIGMFISHTAIFILGGIGIAQTIFLFKADERKARIGYLFTYLLWLACFVLIYVVYLRVLVDQKLPMTHWIDMCSPLFMPSQGVFSLEARKWLIKSILGSFQYPIGLSPVLLAISMFILGAIGIFRSDKKKFLMLSIPMFLMIVASGLRKFPFEGHYILFLLPAVLLLISQGISMVIERGKIGRALGLVIFLILIKGPFMNAVSHGINPQGREEMRPIAQFLQKQQFPGDSLYMNNSAQYAYTYYLKYFHFDLSPNIEGYFLDGSEQDKISLILNPRPSQKGIFLWTHMYRKKGILKDGAHRYKKRTWLILSQLINQDTEQFITGCFDDRGKMLVEFKRRGASLYLYELYEPLTTIQEAAIN